MGYTSQGNVAKQKILDCAANLFSERGFTETTIREIAKEAGFKNPASLYYHFPSKNAILEHMLDDYSKYNNDVFKEKNISEILRKSPSTDGILACLSTSFPPEKEEYFIKILCVLLQEQFRNTIVRNYMIEYFILLAERNMNTIINELKGLGAIRQDADPDFWLKTTSCLFYTFATRLLLGIGDSEPDFTGMGMVEMLRNSIDIMLEKCGAMAPASVEL
jgi:AcrR family transcriptional regulator